MKTLLTPLLVLCGLYAHCCHLTTMSLTSAVDNGDGTFSLVVDVCIAQEGAYGETFDFNFALSGGTFSSIVSFSPDSLTNSYVVGPFGGNFYLLNTQVNASNVGTAINYVVAGPPTPTGWGFLTDGTYCTCYNPFQYCFTLSITTVGAPSQIQLSGAEFGVNCPSEVLSFGSLPVSLVDFSGESFEKYVTLNWSTASEQNNKQFEIQRSEDARHWTGIGTLKGAGTTNENRQYFFNDLNPIDGLIYYRLVQEDFDGRTRTYKTIVVNRMKYKEPTVYPNPSSGSYFLVDIPVNIEERRVNIEIFDFTGKRIHQKEFNLHDSNANVHLGAIGGHGKCIDKTADNIRIYSENWEQGTYIFKMTTPRRTITKQIIKS